jgi:hypothetical protein
MRVAIEFDSPNGVVMRTIASFPRGVIACRRKFWRLWRKAD